MSPSQRPRRHHRRRSPWRRLVDRVKRFLWPPAQVAPSSVYPEPEQKWKPLVFAVALVVAALALFVIIMAESGSGDTQQEQPAQGQ